MTIPKMIFMKKVNKLNLAKLKMFIDIEVQRLSSNIQRDEDKLMKLIAAEKNRKIKQKNENDLVLLFYTRTL
jgi:hypothetical protein